MLKALAKPTEAVENKMAKFLMTEFEVVKKGISLIFRERSVDILILFQFVCKEDFRVVGRN